MNKKAFASIAGLTFIVILVIVFILNILIPDKTFSDEENRLLTSKPHFSISNYIEGRYEKKLESYVDDQFIGRNIFIKAKASADTVEGQLESKGVYRCKDEYLMEDIKIPNQKKLDNTVKTMRHFKVKYPFVNMYFLLAPNAANILSEKLPNTVRVANQNEYMDNFFITIKKQDYEPIDVRNAFKENADKKQLYYRTDHHWTTDGAFLAFNTAAKTMNFKPNIDYKEYVVKNDFRGTLASKSGFTNGSDDAIKLYISKDKDYKNSVIYYYDSKEKNTEFYKLDNLKTKDAYTVFGGSNHPIYSIKTPTKSKKNLLIIKDSYANSFIPFISQYYRKVIVVDPRYFFDNIYKVIDSENISDILFLYNANTFFNDDSLLMMLSNE